MLTPKIWMPNDSPAEPRSPSCAHRTSTCSCPPHDCRRRSDRDRLDRV